MKIPQATGWQALRGYYLDAIPASSTAFWRTAVPLQEWRTAGAFVVASCDRTAIVLQAAGVEIGTTLLADAEMLLDQAAENRATLCQIAGDASWHSPAWALVTLYYWAFFCATAILRMTGKSVLYLDREALQRLRTLAPTASSQPGAGAQELEVGTYVSATVRDVYLRPLKSRLHEATWKVLAGLIAKLLKATVQRSAALEFRFWRVLHELNRLLSPDWPSRVRNAVNYRPGYAYREVVRHAAVDVGVRLRHLTPLGAESLIDELEARTFAISRPTDPTADPRSSCNLLAYYAFALAAVAETAHADIVARSSRDRRWMDMRTDFLRQECSTAPNLIWPFDSPL